ncbi:MGH1-like glycoside hydrolase domain-containing protein [Paenibacillus hexagrammi]|uniref:Mannosylglycerate hydrolase MGH1-like glycoside hydrolase domain-containing protein n=1 Tax=Paenibacillus hexagrammi TaxID=2908839 RepID=A0ABY3SR81_9BACL|nr:trehalase family glycosidase [Paenibacillus sp. YPD9-1]UJF35620.1 hypothetical protein L0M14_11305 [Paenibacillus sp. YPD9-1]
MINDIHEMERVGLCGLSTHWSINCKRAGKRFAHPGSMLLGSTGARLWADYLDPLPGFSGRFDFIHKVNIPLLFQIHNNLTESLEPCRSDWFPSHLHMEFMDHRLTFSERKFISWNDCAVSVQTWTNHSGKDLVLQLKAPFHDRCDRHLQGHFKIDHYSFDIAGAIAVSEPLLYTGLLVKSGESVSFIAAAAFGISGLDDLDLLKTRASAYAEGGLTADQLIHKQKEEYQQWFDLTPVFGSSDPLLDKTWLYRWFLLRHNLADPQYGNLTHPLFYEGRSHKKSKQPFSKGGWEFSKLINLSVPLHIMDARWYQDPVYSEGPLRNMAASPGEDGQFSCMTVDTVMHAFASFSCWAAYQLFLVHRNFDTIAELLPSMKRQILECNRIHGNESDYLMIEYKHTRTGKEYQPSYWFFHDFPKNPKDKTTYTHLKRVDRSVYHYLNTCAIAHVCKVTGDPEAELYDQMAENIKHDVLEKMWDEKTQFFYDLHYQTDEKAFVKNIVGFYPGWAQMIDDRYNGLMEHLLDVREFNTKCPFPTVSADCPAYSKEGGWMGHFVKGRNGCVWNGPAWPYTNSITLDALAKESKRTNHQYDQQFAYFLREYSFLHFMKRDLSQPGIVEHYNSATGEPLSDEQEYNHSFYIDLIISHVAGLSIEPDRIVLDPIDNGLDYFYLDRVKAAGLDIRITYRNPNVHCEHPELEEGYRLYVNNKLVFSNDTLCRIELPIQELSRT